jgi:hypothetical protein
VSVAPLPRRGTFDRIADAIDRVVRPVGVWLGLADPLPPAPTLRPVPTLHPRYSILRAPEPATGVDLLDHVEQLGYPFALTESAFTAASRAQARGVAPHALGLIGDRATYSAHYPNPKEAA